jgi:hypothetical protein
MTSIRRMLGLNQRSSRGHLYEDGKHIGYIEDGFAFDRHDKKRYRVEHPKLRDLSTGEVVGYLKTVGLPGTVTKRGLFD